MSGGNFGRGSQLNYHQVNSQKTLIYDLRSELSNLKNQFSKLINRPTDLTVKSKIENKPILKSRYSFVQSENQTFESQITNNSEGEGIRKSQEISPRFNFNRIETHTTSNNFATSQSVYRLGTTYRKNSSGEASAMTCIVGSHQCNERVQPDHQKSQPQNNITNTSNRIKQYSTIYKKIHNNPPITQSSKTNNIKTDQINQITTSDTNIIIINQLTIAEHKLKQLQLENKTYVDKVNTLTSNNDDMAKRLLQMQVEIQELKSQGCRKDEKIYKLEDVSRELSQKISRANQQIIQINRQKNKEIENIKNNLALDLKNQQKDYERKLAVEKQNFDMKTQSLLNNLKMNYEAKNKQLQGERDKAVGQLTVMSHKCQKLRLELVEAEKKRVGTESGFKQKSSETIRLNQIIKSLSQKQLELQKQICQLRKKPQTKQISSNTDPRPDQLTSQSPPQPSPSPPAQAISLQSEPSQKMQQKLAIYLTNIDKQSIKIKQQKYELQKHQRTIQQCNRIICEKQSIIRNVMRDFKAVEKELNQHRKTKRDVQIILDDYNQCINRLSLGKLNWRYREICEKE